MSRRGGGDLWGPTPEIRLAVRREYESDHQAAVMHRYRLAVATVAEQASRIARFDAVEAARIADDDSATALEAAATAWREWVERFVRARGEMQVVDGGRTST
jgi:hypothetical protein